MALLGWAGLAFFTYNNPPHLLNQAIALAILGLTLLASFLPATYGWNSRRRRDSDIVGRCARQSTLAALFLTLCTALQMMRALNWANAALLLILFILTEMLLSFQAR